MSGMIEQIGGEIGRADNQVKTNPEIELAHLMAALSTDPLRFAAVAFDWDGVDLSVNEGKILRDWQRQVLDYIGERLRAHYALPEEKRRVTNNVIRVAISSGHGVGKSALTAVLTLWALATMPDARVVLTANTEAQLLGKTMAEVAKWYERLICKHWFKKSTTRIHSVERPETWKAEAITWSLERPEAFAGLHNVGRRILVIFDEASAIPDAIWEVAEGALTDRDTEILFVAFGNPTRNSGRFYDAFHAHRRFWHTMKLDARNVEGTNKAQLQQWVEQYGEDSDFVRVRVRGEFPATDDTQFIGTKIVEDAMQREVPVQSIREPIVMGVDVAEYGMDASVLYVRQGLDGRSWGFKVFRGLDNMQLVGKITEWCQTIKKAVGRMPDMIFVDAIGVGAGVVSRLEQLGYPVYRTVASANANKADTYANKRAEIWGEMRDWLISGGVLPNNRDLLAELTTLPYKFDAKNRIQLESKEKLRREGIPSPNIADALAMTFTENVQLLKQKETEYSFNEPNERENYDPIAEELM